MVLVVVVVVVIVIVVAVVVLVLPHSLFLGSKFFVPILARSAHQPSSSLFVCLSKRRSFQFSFPTQMGIGTVGKSVVRWHHHASRNDKPTDGRDPNKNKPVGYKDDNGLVNDCAAQRWNNKEKNRKNSSKIKIKEISISDIPDYQFSKNFILKKSKSLNTI